MSNKAMTSAEPGGEARTPQPQGHDLELDPIRQAVSGIRYGEVRVIIQAGVIVQFERVAKQRLR